ncbi:MAG: hypothetical protein K0R18_1530 [Bacillales bacterium]|nr:hypothetical protein [Bacillales bacterium]
MKRFFVLVLFVYLAFSLSACGSDKKSNSDSKSKEKSEESSKSDQNSTTKKAADGSFSNPITFGSVGIIDEKGLADDNGESVDVKLSVSISNVIRGDEAWTFLKSKDTYNAPAPSGQEWAVFDVDGKYLESTNKNYKVNFNYGFFKAYDGSGKEIDESTVSLGGDGLLKGDGFPGAEFKGWSAVLVPVGSEFTLMYSMASEELYLKTK